MVLIEEKEFDFDNHVWFNGKPPWDENHPLLQFSRAINWKYLLEELSRFYKHDQGRPTTPLRAQAGTLILKFVKNLSDREAVHCVQENIYAQVFCRLTPAQAQDYMHPATGLANFRAKIGSEGMAFLEEVLQAAAIKKPLRRRGQLIVDTTCVPLDIHYPTDIKLLERARKKILKLIEEAKSLGLKELAYRTYNRTARKIFVQFSKKGKPKKETIHKTHKRMLQFVRRNFKQLTNLRDRATRELGARVRGDFELLGFLKELKDTQRKVQAILHQQWQVYRGRLRLPGRIVSFHKDHVRPISRGKFPLDTEFGPKALLAVARGSLYVVSIFYDNVSDAMLIPASLRWFKGRFGRLPKEILGDRGFYARWRANLLRTFSIEPGLQERGPSPIKTATRRRQIRQRLLIEAKISLFKRKFGGNRCRARIDEHEESWIRLGAASMNAHLAFGFNTS